MGDRNKRDANLTKKNRDQNPGKSMRLQDSQQR